MLAEVAADCSLDPALVLAALAEPARFDEIVREERKLRNQGFGGVPSFMLGGHFLFSGAQPVEAMVSTFRNAAAKIRSMQQKVEPADA